MLDGKDVGVCPDGVHPRHVASGVKGARESSLQCHYVLDLGSGVRGSHLEQLHLEGGLDRSCSFGGEAVYKGWLYGGSRGVVLCTFGVWRIVIHLEGSGLPHAMAAGWGWGTAVQWGCLHKWVPEGDCFLGSPCASRAWAGRIIYVIYLGSGFQVGDLESNDP